MLSDSTEPTRTPDARGERATEGTTTSDKATLLLLFVASVTLTVSADVPDTVGVPLMLPVLAFSASPAGNAPAVIDQLYGARPPVADKVAEYETPTVPAGRLLVLIDKGAAAKARLAER